jgi:hypothetical protein
MKMLGTVLCPVISNNAFCISSPSEMLSNSIALNVVNFVSSSLALLQYGLTMIRVMMDEGHDDEGDDDNIMMI